MLSEILRLTGFADLATLLTLSAAAFFGGSVRGFTGFGFSMVFVPIAASVVGPTVAVPLIWLMDIPFAIPLAAKSYKRADWSEVIPLLIGAAFLMPVGVYLLTSLNPTFMRWIFVVAILISLFALFTGWRYRGKPGRSLSFGVGGLSGLASGMAQLGGMPLAVFWLAAQKNDAAQTKNNLNAYFGLAPIASGFFLWYGGILNSNIVVAATFLSIPYGVGLLLGIRMFGFATEQTFRHVAYSVIAIACLLALPILDGFIGR